MQRIYLIATLIICHVLIVKGQGFTLDQVKSYPFPNELSAASTVNRIAWAVDESGLRNIYVAEAPDYKARKLTNYTEDHGQELSSVKISPDGNWVVYIKGGDFGSNWDDEKPVNPAFLTDPPKVQIWSVPYGGGQPKVMGDGDDFAISPKSDKVVFAKDGQLYMIPIDSSAGATKLFTARGVNHSPQWSPDGTKIAFVSSRGDHAFIGIYEAKDKPLMWIDPSFDIDSSPRWSPDGSRLAYVRRDGRSFEQHAILEDRHQPWSVMVADLATGKSKKVWTAPTTVEGSFPSSQGSTNLHYAHKRVVFLSYHDGWPHMFSVADDGGAVTSLTPGNFMAEFVSLSPDKRSIWFCANTGNDVFDIDRRHLVRVSVDKPDMQVVTSGIGSEWTPFALAKNNEVAYISATAQRPPLVSIMDAGTKKIRLVGEEMVPADFPTKQLVTPKQVVITSPDGTKVHATLFEPAGKKAKSPAVVYIHGGPMRQMLLTWHYSNYYSNAYALNQYLASKGIAVLSINYRMGIGYGYKFQFPIDGGWRGAAEYQDITAAGEWLAAQPSIDPSRIGVYGGSYGGYLTAMALGRDSKLFAAGVDIHGVHERTLGKIRNWLLPDQYEKPVDGEEATKIAWQSSPTADVATWTSPVLIIHADDDRNVNFNQSTDLVQRLKKKGVELETLVIVDDTHHFMLFDNQMKVNKATADYFIRKFKP